MEDIGAMIMGKGILKNVEPVDVMQRDKGWLEMMVYYDSQTVNGGMFQPHELGYFMKTRPPEAMDCIQCMHNGTAGTVQLFKVFSFNGCSYLGSSLHLGQMMRLLMAISFRRVG